VSIRDVRKPISTQEFIKVLTEAAEKECKARSLLKGKPTKPTVSGTAKILNVHRDTLYSWLESLMSTSTK